ncbi:hypothetical protein F511_41235 [Dorcoceras hygrometricum]|uniref:Uncharacterized protein n=1 Tax=Dorcoceras hygrometricum TaxID=472368 RepID=A0A2Z7A1W7_9LAMI|nr:hypothetical protein F511_41235 [Dorcoceras hygrometricum]
MGLHWLKHHQGQLQNLKNHIHNQNSPKGKGSKPSKKSDVTQPTTPMGLHWLKHHQGQLQNLKNHIHNQNSPKGKGSKPSKKSDVTQQTDAACNISCRAMHERCNASSVSTGSQTNGQKLWKHHCVIGCYPTISKGKYMWLIVDTRTGATRLVVRNDKCTTTTRHHLSRPLQLRIMRTARHGLSAINRDYAKQHRITRGKLK